MSADAVSRMSTNDLIAEFARLAQEIRTIFTLTEIPAVTPEREAAKGSLAIVAGELRGRRPIAQLRALFDHENNDVRAYAAIQFGALDEDWACATLSALEEGVSTKQMIAMCDHAKREPPTRPTLQDMTVPQLVARFEDAGMRRYASRFCGEGEAPYDVELSNRIVVETREIFEELTSRGAASALLPLLDHANVSVRADAAMCCLQLAPERALPVLEAMARDRTSIDGGGAAHAIDRWRGKFDPPKA